MFVWFCVLIPASVYGQIMTGEPHSVSVNDTQVLAAARFAVAEFNEVNSEERFVYRIVTITSAKIQVVAGMNYILDVLLGRTVCRKGDAAANSETCAFHSKPKEYQCHFVVTEIPWEKSRVLSKNECRLIK